MIQCPLLTSYQHAWELTAVFVNLFPYLMMAHCLVQKCIQAFPVMTHREPSHPFRIWIKDQISRYFEFLVHARGKLRGLLVRSLEPRLRKSLVACSEISLYYFRWTIGSSEKFASPRLPCDLRSRPRISRPRNLPRARIKNSQRPPQNTRDKGYLIFHSYSKTDVRAPCDDL